MIEVFDTNNAFAQKTVFAPVNEAFAALSAETLDSLNDAEVLQNVLEYHLAGEKIMSTELNCNIIDLLYEGPITMANGGETNTICDDLGAVYQLGTGVNPGVNSIPQIVTPDIETCYGAVHVIDQVLIPA